MAFKQYYDPKTNTLVVGVAVVLVADAIIKYHYSSTPGVSKKSATSTPRPTNSQQGLVRSLIAIAVLVIVMTFVNNQVPDFGGPFTVLVLVVALMKAAPSFTKWYNDTQGIAK